MKKLLTDPRAPVRKKAAHAVGKLHLDVDESNIKALCAMLKADDPNEVEQSLKALRNLDAPSAVPEVLPLLKSDRVSNIREACRTLAVLANKDVILYIEPLLQHSDSAVRKDAKNAIAKLSEKP
jgi:HEAT repeat protein